ncbi:gfo/Idh/MocA family oxidoreductase [Sulfolobus islandicus]|uniref:Oxidoreductase domain protein n=1 Tax=Saccharolobus islandicus (strain HVE10/4) TaxID=930943 RepID=F0NLA0_SACI0|nr:Gfo/Idh/MocA family oxidoreductase [Sulfolobus islandicus]ADX83591.1 oxidoreductase domain protein [Sulfolobus islandicus HVE10/4]WCM37671.1 gfo/Idh/MocA family oxidoreductase [Sulfolobus islandicus]
MKTILFFILIFNSQYMSKRIGVAVVGLGSIGKTHVKALKDLEKETEFVKLVAVVDQIKSIAEKIGSEYGTPYYTTIDEVLRNSEVDVISIATPSYLHAPQAILAIEYGKHVIVEKPMATTLAGAREMVSRAERNEVKLGVIFQERYAPDIRRLKNDILKELGRIYLIESELKWYRDMKGYYKRDEIARSWRGMWNTEGGGVMTNQGIHTIDLMIWLNGEVEEVSGFVDNLTHDGIEVEDTAVAIMRYKNGALGTISQTVSMKPTTYQYRKIRVNGSNGFVEITDGSLSTVAIEGKIEESKSSVEYKKETIAQPGNLHKELLRDFLRALSEDNDFPINGKEGMKSLEVIKAVYLSSVNRQVAKLPLDVRIVV